MKQYEYLLLREAIKQNAFRRMFIMRTIAIVIAAVGVIFLVTYIMNVVNTSQFGEKLEVAYYSIYLIVSGIITDVVFNNDIRKDRKKQLDDLLEAKKWSEEHPEKEVDFKQIPRVYSM